MRKFIVAAFTLLTCSAAFSQPPRITLYSLDNIQLPAELNKQVCISGMKFYKGELYFASERCPKIIVFDPRTASIARTIALQVPQNFEMEGMTSFNDQLYLVSENIAAVYQVNPVSGALLQVATSNVLPAKSKEGDGMEGIAANEKHGRFYLLRERNEKQDASQLYTYRVEKKENSIELIYESMIELPLESAQWRYSDICVDEANSRLLCLKSFLKGKFRQQFLESISIGKNGQLERETLQNIHVENFTDASSAYKTQNFSMNLEGITIDNSGNIFIISDNTSGKANCEMEAKEKTILLHLKKK